MEITHNTHTQTHIGININTLEDLYGVFTFFFSLPAIEVLKGSANRKPSPADLHSFQHPRVSQLVEYDIRVEPIGLLEMADSKTNFSLTLNMIT